MAGAINLRSLFHVKAEPRVSAKPEETGLPKNKELEDSVKGEHTKLKHEKEQARIQQQKVQEAGQKLEIKRTTENERITREEHREAATKADTKKEEAAEAKKQYEADQAKLTEALGEADRKALSKTAAENKQKWETKEIEHTQAKDHADKLKLNHDGSVLDKKVVGAHTEVYNTSKQVHGFDDAISKSEAEVTRISGLTASKKNIIENDTNLKPEDKTQKLTALREEHNKEVQVQKDLQTDLKARREHAGNQLEAKNKALDDAVAKQAAHPGNSSHTATPTGKSDTATTNSSTTSSSGDHVSAKEWKKDSNLSENDKTAITDGLKNENFYVHKNGKTYYKPGFESDGKGGAKEIDGFKDGILQRNKTTAYVLGAGVVVAGGYMVYNSYSKKKDEQAQGAQAAY